MNQFYSRISLHEPSTGLELVGSPSTVSSCKESRQAWAVMSPAASSVNEESLLNKARLKTVRGCPKKLKIKRTSKLSKYNSRELVEKCGLQCIYFFRTRGWCEQTGLNS
jgi:hypothetical protein